MQLNSSASQAVSAVPMARHVGLAKCSPVRQCSAQSLAAPGELVGPVGRSPRLDVEAALLEKAKRTRE